MMTGDGVVSRMKRRERIVIALAGKIGAGKTTIASFLNEQFGFVHLRSRDVLSGILEDRGLPVDDAALQDLGAKIVQERGRQAVSEILLNRCSPDHSYVVDALRFVDEAEYLRERLGGAFKLVFLTATEELRRQRFLDRRSDRDVTNSSFVTRSAHEVEADVPSLIDAADATLTNIDLSDVASQLSALTLNWLYRSRPTAVQEAVEAVAEFHRKHGFDIATRDRKVMQYRMGLLVEELGEINECLSKGRGDIAEEHADLLILLLGNCITMGIDLEAAFWKKYTKIMRRPAKQVGGTTRVSHWKTEASSAATAHGYYHVDLHKLLDGGEMKDDLAEVGESPAQLDLFDQ
jgi:dephospho-CoA kinase/NTP pyrophosphatase (non-canonical NTP hydrolase)